MAERILSSSGNRMLLLGPIFRGILQEWPEFFLIDCLVIGFLGRNPGMTQMLQNRVIERLVAFLFADLDHAWDLMRFRFANEVGNRHIYDQNFQGRHSPWPIDPFEEILRDNPFERFSESGPNLVLLIGRKNIDDAINRLRRTRGMQRSKDKVASCGRS